MLEIDSNEPPMMFAYTVPVLGTNVTQTSLNNNGWADYRWPLPDDTFKHCERKTWGELLANTDKVEEQLYRHLTKQPQSPLVFMLEGMAVSGELRTQLLSSTKSGIYVRSKGSSIRLKRIYSWLYQIGKYCEVVCTSGLEESATMLVAMYESDQKTEHSVLNRYIKQVTFNPNPQVTTLMGASSGIGEARAESLIKHSSTAWNVWSAGWHGIPAINTWEELTKIEGLGPTIVRNMLRGIGRPDV